MKERMVGGAPVKDAAGMMEDFWQKIGSGALTWEEFARFLKRQHPFSAADEWVEAIVTKERSYHDDFFGEEMTGSFDYKLFRATLEKYGQEKIAEWRKLGLEPHCLPSVEMRQDVEFPGWKVKPKPWYYEQVAAGKVGYLDKHRSFVPDREAFKLPGVTVLVDVRCKPNYYEGRQIWQDDNLLGPIIEQLRQEGKIVKYEYGPQLSSRFSVSAKEAEQALWLTLAECLGLEPGQIRSERAIEANVLSQILTDKPRARDGNTNAWIWYADIFGDADDRLIGGHSDYGGLGSVHSSDFRWCRSSVRPLAVL